ALRTVTPPHCRGSWPRAAPGSFMVKSPMLIYKITQEMQADGVWPRRKYHDFDRDLYYYTTWLIAPVACFIFWLWRQRYLPWRIARGRILDVEEAHHCRTGTLRPISRWTLRKTR